MLSSILRSSRAIHVNIKISRNDMLQTLEVNG
jgi:hypothetical protein